MSDLKTRKTPTARSLPRFVPVIFGNGEDDDTPGLEACFHNEAVQVDCRIYEPGEDVVIEGKHLVVQRYIGPATEFRSIYITNCHFDVRI